MQRLKEILRSEEGQLLPFIAIIMLLLILFTALQFSLSMAYLSRAKVRDALDSAVLSAVSLAEKRSSPTRYGERRKRIDEDTYVWVKTTSGNKNYLALSRREAINIAEEYFLKNLRLSNLKSYKILDLDIKIKEDVNMLQVNKRRPRTEGITTSWEENFPRWIKVECKARVEVPAPLGGVFGKDKLVVQVEADSRKNFTNLPIGVIWN